MAVLSLICPLLNDKSHVTKMNYKDSLITNQKTYQTYNSQHQVTALHKYHSPLNKGFHITDLKGQH